MTYTFTHSYFTITERLHRMSRLNGVTVRKQFNHRVLQHEISVYQADDNK